MSVLDALALAAKEKANAIEIRHLEKTVAAIRRESFQFRNAAQLSDQTEVLRNRLAKGESLDALLVSAFGLVAESVRRIFRKSLHDVQLIGGIILHQGRIAEMRSGEGKTLTAILPAYLNALAGQVHIATTSDYLAERDKNWMGPVFLSLGLTADTILTTKERAVRAAAYQADVVYATNHELAFDELIDHLAYAEHDRIFPGFRYAIIDEIDSILIDEARTPLIVAQNITLLQSNLRSYAELVDRLEPDKDFRVDYAAKTVILTDRGLERIEELTRHHGIYEHRHIDQIFYLNNALRAKTLFTRDRDYIVEDGHVYIVDEFTGRVMRDRRFSEGIHQAIEAKEELPIRPSEAIMAETTYQNFFLKYKKLAGLTGTVVPEDEELAEIFHLPSVTVPADKPARRKDLPDLFFPSRNDKFAAIATQAKNYAQNGRPVLIGTRTVQDSEALSVFLDAQGIAHQLLNAKHMLEEKEVVLRAGNPGMITVATNMAGRGVDIILHPESRSAGGLVVLGTERHFSRRIDEQLAGRAGRQGEAGVAQFFLAPDDELPQLFGSTALWRRLKKLSMTALGVSDERLSALWRQAQQTAEMRDRNVRLLNLELSRNVEAHREVIYAKRNAILNHTDLVAELLPMLQGEFTYLLQVVAAGRQRSDWDMAKFYTFIEPYVTDRVAVTQFFRNAKKPREIEAFLLQNANRRIADFMARKERAVLNAELQETLLAVIDRNFAEHLQLAESMKERLPLLAIGGLAVQKEFEKQLHTHYELMLIAIRSEALRSFFTLQRGDL